MKIFLSLILACASLLAGEKIVVAASPVPHAQILKAAQPILKKQGYELEVKEFNDYVLPNMVLDAGEVDANFFQHLPYLKEFNKNKDTKLISIAGIHLEPMGLYSSKHKGKGVEIIKEGMKIAIPNDPTNESRALEILAKKGLISLDDVPLKTILDITDNPKDIQFLELKAAQLPRVLGEVDFAMINANYALSAGLNPLKDTVLIETNDSPYVNIVVVKEGKENEAKLQALKKAMQSKEVKKYIEENYKGAIIPAF